MNGVAPVSVAGADGSAMTVSTRKCVGPPRNLVPGPDPQEATVNRGRVTDGATPTEQGAGDALPDLGNDGVGLPSGF